MLSGNSLRSDASSGGGSTKYIYELPYFDRKEICRIFDDNSAWEALGGGLMGYSSSELAEFRRALYRGDSPTEALLTSWGNQNHTILELFTLCGRLYHGRAMKVLAKYVDPKYHAYIRDPDFHATQELGCIDPPTKALEAPALNIKPLEKKDDKKDDKAKKGPIAMLSESAGLLPQIPYNELTEATNGWDKRNWLGKGGFGTVYKGLWKNTAVAIKRMEANQRPSGPEAYVESQMKQSLGEMKFLNSYRHDNILPLYGYCLEGPHPCLLYQFMTNGSLEDRILCRQKTVPLTWHLRYHIAKGVACGIQFLHSIGNQPLIHGDIKSANILIDKNFEAKVGDFGLAREMASPTPNPAASYVKVSRVHGTRPYLPDEYLRSKKLSTKVDTYSFGIVLFELATGLRAYEEHRQKKFLKDLVEDLGPDVAILKDAKPPPEGGDVFSILLNAGRACTERIAKRRPEMVEVLKSIEAALPHSSISGRTLSHTHFTGLPYLFEPPSRPGSLGIPQVSSAYTTNRNSPEMRAGSPHWIPPHGLNANPQVFQGFPSPIGARKVSHPSSQLSAPTPIRPNQVQQQLPPPIIPSPSPSSNSNNIMTPLTIDTRGPEVNVIQASPMPSPRHTPLPIDSPIQEVDTNDIDDLYLPLVVEEVEANHTVTTEDGDGAATVIPLITELGIK